MWLIFIPSCLQSLLWPIRLTGGAFPIICPQGRGKTKHRHYLKSSLSQQKEAHARRQWAAANVCRNISSPHLHGIRFVRGIECLEIQSVKQEERSEAVCVGINRMWEVKHGLYMWRLTGTWGFIWSIIWPGLKAAFSMETAGVFTQKPECHPTMTTLQFTLMLISDNSFPSVHFEVSVVPSVKTLVKDRHN